MGRQRVAERGRPAVGVTPAAQGPDDCGDTSNTPPQKPTADSGAISRAAASGTKRDLLVALRDHIATVIDDGCSPRDLVGLSRRLIDLAGEVRALDAASSELRSVPVDGAFDPEAV